MAESTGATTETAKKEATIKEDEIQLFVNMGLGRGIDITCQSPWKNKSSFQVRYPTYEGLIGTEEGGYKHSYQSDLSSTYELQLNLSSSLYVPNIPVSVGVEGELSRSSIASKKIVGERVVNRTISFRSDLSASTTDDSHDSFEEMLSKWILNYIGHQTTDAGDSVTQLSGYTDNASKEEKENIITACAEFINSYGITHYVNSITMGALEHTVVSEADYSLAVKAGVNFEYIDIATLSSSSSLSRSTKKSKTDAKYIGKIVDGKVERGSYDEAVIEIKILSLNSLINQSRFVQLALHLAIVNYVKAMTFSPTGPLMIKCPFLIQCGDKELFWQVKPDDHSLTLTDDKTKASAFYIHPCDDTDNLYDFTIGWKGETQQEIIDRDEDLDAIGESGAMGMMRYLETKTNIFGNNPGPLKMRSELRAKYSRLSIYSQLTYKFTDAPVNINMWIKGNKVFFVSNSHRNGFIAVDLDKATFKCVKSQKLHDEDTTYMLFRLVAVGPKFDAVSGQKSQTSKSHIKLVDELKKYAD